MICETDGWVLRGMQFGAFGVLLHVIFGCWWRCGHIFREIDGRVLRGMQSGMLEQEWVLFEVLAMARARFCDEIDGQVLGGMQFGARLGCLLGWLFVCEIDSRDRRHAVWGAGAGAAFC